MSKSQNVLVCIVLGSAVVLLGAGCATAPKQMEPVSESQTSSILQELQVMEQPALEPEWADYVKNSYPYWRRHYWVDRGQWGNRGYIVGRAPVSEQVAVEAEITPLPPAEPAAPAIVESAPPQIETPERPTKYVVKKGDCLWKIAGKVYRNPLKWPRIYRANKDKIKNPNLIYPNQVLEIPWD